MENNLPPVICLRSAIHIRGTPYPEMEFDREASEYGRKYTPYACFSNQDIKNRIDEHYNRYPKAKECSYFWYEMFKERPTKEEV